VTVPALEDVTSVVPKMWYAKAFKVERKQAYFLFFLHKKYVHSYSSRLSGCVK